MRASHHVARLDHRSRDARVHASMQSYARNRSSRVVAAKGSSHRRAPRPFGRARAAMAKPTRVMFGQVAVEGGSLRGPTLVPTITESDVVFAKISMAPQQWFRKYCMRDGRPAGDDSSSVTSFESTFLKFLQKARGAKLIATMKEHVESNDGSWAEAQKNKSLIFDQIPKTLEISVPDVKYGEEAKEGFSMRVLAVARSSELLAVELSGSNLEYLRLGVLAYSDADPVAEDLESPPKRSKVHLKPENRIRIQECPNVFWNSQRTCWYINFTDQDGFVHRKSYHVTKSDVDEKYQENRIATAHIAQAAYDRLAAGGASEDGDPEDDEIEE